MYDGDGKRVEQVYVVFTDGEITGTLTTSYFSGGAYEVRTDGATSATLKYYSFAGMSIAMKDSSGLKYLLTDQLGSVVAVTDSSGNLHITYNNDDIVRYRKITVASASQWITKPGDFNNDGKDDMAVYDADAGKWYLTHRVFSFCVIPDLIRNLKFSE